MKNLKKFLYEQTMQNRAETLSARYKSRFAEYDLNNEMIHGIIMKTVLDLKSLNGWLNGCITGIPTPNYI